MGKEGDSSRGLSVCKGCIQGKQKWWTAEGKQRFVNLKTEKGRIQDTAGKRISNGPSNPKPRMEVKTRCKEMCKTNSDTSDSEFTPTKLANLQGKVTAKVEGNAMQSHWSQTILYC